MQNGLIAAGALAILTGVVHSILGERRIFLPMRNRLPPAGEPSPELVLRYLGILRASWHVVTILGGALGILLIQFGLSSTRSTADTRAITVIALAMVCAAIAVAIWTKGRHPGAASLLAIAVLCWMA